MNPSTNTFLAELYEIDPGLRAHEAEIIPLIEKLLKNDPATAPDPAFVAQLRAQLRERAHAMHEDTASRFSWSNMFYALSGALTVLIVLPVAYLAWNHPSVPSGQTEAPLFGYHVEEKGQNAFGSLKDVHNIMAGGTGGGGMGARDQSGGGGPVATPVPAPAMASAPENAALDGNTPDMKMIAPDGPMYQFDYVYDGELSDLAETVTVYKRDPSGAVIPMQSLADRMNLGTIDLGTFKNMNVESVSFSQNVPYGYQLYVNLRDASMSINAQWDQWPQSKCQTDACYQAQRVKIGDIPSDADLIAVAKRFASDHGIDLQDYGDPAVDTTWKRDYERAPNKADAYIPDSMRVIFPLMMDGRPVLDQGGQKTGISMGVHVKEKKVMDVWGIADRAYLKSEYAGVTDAAAIKGFIGKTDAWMDSLPKGMNVQKATVTLGEPSVGYATFYAYRAGVNEELLIPSLIFPVKDVSGAPGGYYRENVVVPLAKDIFEQQSIIPPVMPLEGGPAVDPAPKG